MPKHPQNTPWGPRVLSRCTHDFYQFSKFHVFPHFSPRFSTNSIFSKAVFEACSVHFSRQKRAKTHPKHEDLQVGSTHLSTDFSKDVFFGVGTGGIQNNATWKRGLNHPVEQPKTHTVWECSDWSSKFRVACGSCGAKAPGRRAPFVPWLVHLTPKDLPRDYHTSTLLPRDPASLRCIALVGVGLLVVFLRPNYLAAVGH